MVKIFKILFRKFTRRHRSTLLRWNFVKFIRRQIGELVRYLPHKKFRLPRTQNLPRPAPSNWFTLFEISSKSIHFRRSYSLTREHRSFAPYSICIDRFGWIKKYTTVVCNTEIREIYRTVIQFPLLEAACCVSCLAHMSAQILLHYFYSPITCIKRINLASLGICLAGRQTYITFDRDYTRTVAPTAVTSLATAPLTS